MTSSMREIPPPTATLDRRDDRRNRCQQVERAQPSAGSHASEVQNQQSAHAAIDRRFGKVAGIARYARPAGEPIRGCPSNRSRLKITRSRVRHAPRFRPGRADRPGFKAGDDRHADRIELEQRNNGR